ncbi:uncharacterized protein EI97DRAFT_435358 [Westerdykella ornata]|uniref:XRCC4 coiled-coil domain-containing protein n=1 Tax=Westerdykella ornata TaxID=318751 RepID=A0A6A6JDB8_WESOR|nr:uncharacterized protein EI97DRAFT_435358 [Westerdykella ornata]KAF2274265.1 hypothetical protein EI97DRAFT_435358 [Westerdykella ornata]
MAGGDTHIISIPAATQGQPGFVIEVKQTGEDPLDVRLVGSEGEYCYVTKLKKRNIGALKHKASTDEWEAIVSHFLLQKPLGKKQEDLLQNVRIEYTLTKDQVHVTLRRDVQGIKVTLGEIVLARTEEEEIDPIAWAYASSKAHNEALKEIERLKSMLEDKSAAMEKLNAQLDDFIKTKQETETAMLQQFMVLLNEKKRKIRDQARLLAGAKVDKATAAAVKSARETTKPRRAGQSRASKRKATAPEEDVSVESDSAQMEIDESKAEEQDDASGPEAETPDRSTDDETEDEEDTAVAAAKPEVKTVRSESASTSATPSSKTEPPPRRELPFLRNKATRKQPSPPAPDDDETEDDEL